ncbi:MAG: ERAP1-like C-terminal domain-containing protein [Acidobacteria bacterium]|nr:ERAP1-like C-terminal domain-containing protein [Acidobacteriota bacterium]
MPTLFLAITLVTTTLTAQSGSEPPGRGIPESLARARAAAVRDLRYELAFVVPDDRGEPVQGRAVLRFRLAAPHRLVLDFAQPPERLRHVRVGGADVAFTLHDGHLTIPASATKAGDNEIAVEFLAGDEPLNRDPEFLYTLFVPARAHRAFPCFDQPDLKARYTLTLEIPAGWQAVSNAAAVATEAAERRTRIRFAETPPIPTYLFAFVAGRFSVETAERNGRPFRLFHRETDVAKVARNREAVFDLHAAALAWLEEYTGIPYPFGKFDFIALPSFQFSGMEHPGAVYYNAASLLVEESATQNQLLARAGVIAHETAHMWFGNLVTMRWFNDVWMKEVFANFMAAKIVNPLFPQVNHELRFLLAHYPETYQVDRTAGANPIRQGLANLDEAGQLYGAIIYGKAPIVMRQLEMIVGERAFRDALREYLKTYRFGTATWLDLVRILDARTPENLSAWSRAWVEERGRPEFTSTLRTGRGRVSRLTLTMSDPLRRGLVWPQRLRVGLGYATGIREVPLYIDGRTTRVREAERLPPPLFVLPNAGGLGYGLFLLDETSRTYLLGHIETIADPLTRGSAWVTLWENLLEAAVTPGGFLDAVMRSLPRESDEQNVQRVLAYTTRAFWRHLPPEERARRAPALEAMLRAGIERAPTTSAKAAWFAAFRDVVLTPAGVQWLEAVWRRQEGIPGLTLAETDEIAMALELAVREVPTWRDILQAQHDRIQNSDRKARFAFAMPALSADPAERERAFARLRQVEHRRREPWAIESLAYLNHPLRDPHARRFLRPALELLREIQQTGDIFFPARWTEAVLGGHRSPEAAAIIRDFLGRELQYPQRLRWTILTAADELFRVAGPT